MGNVWARWGVFIFVPGVVLLGLAVSASAAQAVARHKFPDLQFGIYGLRRVPRPGPRLPVTAGTSQSVFDQEFVIRATNRETGRIATLGFILIRDLDRIGPFGEREWSFLPRGGEVLWTIGPGLTDQRAVIFDMRPPDGYNLGPSTSWCIEVVDLNSGRRVNLRFPGPILGYNRTNWEPVPRFPVD